MSTVTITNTDVAGQVIQSADVQVLGTIDSFRDAVAVPARIGAKPLRQIDAALGLASMSGEHRCVPLTPSSTNSPRSMWPKPSR